MFSETREPSTNPEILKEMAQAEKTVNALKKDVK